MLLRDMCERSAARLVTICYMKVLKFQADLVPLVLSGQKTSTWRLFDDKNLTVGDEIELREFGVDSSFARAVIERVVEKPFGKLTTDDKKGHEGYTNDRQMYETYTKYYKTPVGPHTTVKIVWFSLKG